MSNMYICWPRNERNDVTDVRTHDRKCVDILPAECEYVDFWQSRGVSDIRIWSIESVSVQRRIHSYSCVLVTVTSPRVPNGNMDVATSVPELLPTSSNVHFWNRK